MLRAQALPIAERLVELLRPACERIEVAGSLRRGKEEVHDIELVALPRWDPCLFDGERPVASTALDSLLEGLLNATRGEVGEVAWDPELRRNGPRYKRLLVDREPVDLFLADERNFGNVLAIRTGCAGFSKALVTDRRFGGLMPKGLRHMDGYLWRLDTSQVGAKATTIVPCPTEEAYFEALGLPVPPPKTRDADCATRARQWLEKRGEL